jgi:hypothetical protein
MNKEIKESLVNFSNFDKYNFCAVPGKVLIIFKIYGDNTSRFNNGKL